MNGVSAEYVTNNLNQNTAAGDTSYEYDTNGNLVSKDERGQSWSYEYDSNNRLVRVVQPDGTDTKYEYDALGNRVAKVYDSSRTEYLVDPFGFGDVIGEYNGSGALVAKYSHGLGLVSRTDAEGTKFYDFNSIGSTVGLTGEGGKYINRYRYLPFGNSLSEDEAVPNPFEFVGQFGIMEENNGLDYMRGRFYDSETGRFTSPDPIGLNGGDINLYRYANNSPLIQLDPGGNWAFLIRPALGAILNTTFYILGTPEEDRTLGKLLGSIVTGAVGGHRWDFAKKSGATGFTKKILNVNGGMLAFMLGKMTEAAIDGKNPYDSRNDLFWDLGLSAINPFLPGLNKIPSIIKMPSLTENLLFISNNIWKRSIKAVIDFSKNSNLLDNAFTRIVTSLDPNDIIGPAGFGAEGWLVGEEILPYTVRFENIGDIPAVFVNITHQLDPDLDFSTFELGNFGFGDLTIDVPKGLQNYSARLDLTDSINAFVDFKANFDPATGTVTWNLTTINPDNGRLATGLDDGFLPPNVNGSGEGFVRYKIKPQTNVPTGTRIEALADIVFDTNEPIATPPIFNTIDVSTPISSMKPLSAKSNGQFFPAWEGVDDGSGIRSYDVYVSVDSQPFQLWLQGTPNNSETFIGEVGRSYAFYSKATDNVGGIEPGIPKPQTTTTVITASNLLPTDLSNPVTFNDKIFTGIAITGTEGDDNLLGTSSSDKIDGLSGNDRILGNRGRDNLDGEMENDLLYGGKNDDTIRGGTGSDVLFGDRGNDFLIGVNANNTAPGIMEIDTLVGGTGIDTFVLGGETAYYEYSKNGDYALIQDLNSSEDVIQLQGNPSEYSLESATEGTAIYRGQYELVGVIQYLDNLSLDSDTFSFI
jgi:RHS repeat-associated protein